MESAVQGAPTFGGPPLELPPPPELPPPRGPQSVQSVPRAHSDVMEPEPPSSHSPSPRYAQVLVHPALPELPPELLEPPVRQLQAARSTPLGQMRLRVTSVLTSQPAPPELPPELAPPGTHRHRA